ncbi:arabinosyltransferase domain-containing protein [Mycolicibacterium cosmeticum]|uniref:arabinosyltransferase domain-containing protein n=1 Tax=Mycolicibacterium cosmeticum TaxID=258533 RepID=UPI003204F887
MSQRARDAPPAWLALLVGLVGIVAGLALPFCPVRAQTTTLTWPVPGQAVVSSSAIVVPYRPLHLQATIPCPALRATTASDARVIALSTGSGAAGLTVGGDRTGINVGADGRSVHLPVPRRDVGCDVHVEAGPNGMSVRGADSGRAIELPGQPVPEVFGFRTGLDAAVATGMQVRVEVGDSFTTSPGPLKSALIGVQVAAAAAALWLLPRPAPRRRRWRWRRWDRVWWVDAAVVMVLAGWAVIGPLAVDDGWATMIARNQGATGNPGNYYRWWNAAETPFALSQQLLAPMTGVSVAPLWLRGPSTVLAVATWFVLTRGVLRAALPDVAASIRVRGLAALFLLATWLPFNLGTRPEPYVALGVTAGLALAMRARSPVGVGWLLLVVAVTVPISANGVLVVAPIVVFAPRLIAAVRSASTRIQTVAVVAMLGCVAAVALTVVFADQTWDGVVVATDWHNFFGPSLRWYDEPLRYRYLLRSDQQGSFAKRLPVLLSIAMVPITVLAGRRRGDRIGRVGVRLAGVVAMALLLLALSPSKWSYHLGSVAGLFAALLTVGVVMLCRRVATADRYGVLAGVAGSILAAGAVALAFAGPNAWWLPAVYDVPWADAAPRPLGLPLAHPLLWIGLVAVLSAAAGIAARRRGALWVVSAGPAVIAVTAVGVGLALLVGSFVAAPIRRPAGSLALMNMHRISGGPLCGLADDVEVLPDGAVLDVAADSGGAIAGFIAHGGFLPSAPPPDPPGSGTSTFLWGSRAAGVAATATMTSPWFVLPVLSPDAGIAVSVSGRTDGGNTLAFEFGHSAGTQVSVLSDRGPPDRPAAGEDPDHPLWRTIGVDATDVPPGADRVRIQAVDTRTDAFGWLAFTGPRLRSVVPLNRFLAAHRPVLLSWPQSFVFPCVRDIATVSGGVAQTPGVVIESPRPWLTEDRDPELGGTFAELAQFGNLYEIPSRLIGHPELDWGTVKVSGDTASRDAYQRTVAEVTVPGSGGVMRQRPQR